MARALGEVRQFKSSGSGNLSVPIRPGYRFVVSYIRCHFRRTAGSGTDTANFTVDLDSDEGTDFDVRLLTSTTAVGVGTDLHVRITDDAVDQWTFEDGDGLTFNWTNPDAGEINWGLIVGVRSWQ